MNIIGRFSNLQALCEQAAPCGTLLLPKSVPDLFRHVVNRVSQIWSNIYPPPFPKPQKPKTPKPQYEFGFKMLRKKL